MSKYNRNKSNLSVAERHRMLDDVDHEVSMLSIILMGMKDSDFNNGRNGWVTIHLNNLANFGLVSPDVCSAHDRKDIHLPDRVMSNRIERSDLRSLRRLQNKVRNIEYLIFYAQYDLKDEEKAANESFIDFCYGMMI